jgi:hypothetical protein
MQLSENLEIDNSKGLSVNSDKPNGVSAACVSDGLTDLEDKLICFSSDVDVHGD